MKRVAAVVCLLALLAVRSSGQYGGIRGELRYEHEYQDVLNNDNLMTLTRRAPALSLSTTGAVISKRLLSYTVRTSLNANFGTSHSRGETFGTTQFLWNAYDLNLMFLQTSPLSFEVGAREHTTDTRYDYNSLSVNGGVRQQDQSVSFSLQRIRFLPTLRFAYQRSRSWSLTGERNELVSQGYSFSASASGPAGSVSLSGSMTGIPQANGSSAEQVFMLDFGGSRQLSDREWVNASSNYNRYPGFSGISGGFGYGASLSSSLQVSTTVSGQTASSAYYLNRSVGIAQNVRFAQSARLQYGLTLTAVSSTVILSRAAGERRLPSDSWGASATALHNRPLGFAFVTNGVALRYLQRNYIRRSSSWGTNLSNGITTSIGSFSLEGSHNFFADVTENYGSWFSIGNSVHLSSSGYLPERIQSRTSAEYVNSRTGGDIEFAENQQSLSVSQAFESSFSTVIPFSISIGGSTHWYLTSVRGHTYGWQLTFASMRFFARGLGARYSYTRSFDPYYREETVEHNASFTYQWRALAFELNLRQSMFVSRNRDVTFRVSRPF